MKKTVSSLLIVLLVLLAAGCGKQITMDEAKQIALKDAGKTAAEVSFVSESMEKKNSASDTRFQMTFVSEGGKWEYQLNGKGEILQKAMELSQEEFKQYGLIQESEAAAAAAVPKQPETSSAAAPAQTTAAAVQAAGNIGLEQAKALALQDAGKTVSEVSFTKTKEDREAFGIEYEIEFYTKDAEYEYEIRQDGTVTKREMKPFTVQTQNVSGTAVSLEQAKALALANAGVNAADVIFTEAKTDFDDGITKYEIEFRSGSTKWEFEVNAANGQILKAEKEN